MQLPFPERIPIQYAATFAAVLFVAEQIQGTDVVFSICVFLFIVIATFAFNMAGGLTRPSGGYVFFYAVLGAIVGWFWKAIVGEAADTNLHQPNLTAAVFLGGISSMALAVFLSRKLSRRRGMLEDLLQEKDVPTATLGCAILGISITLAGYLLPHKDGTILSAVIQINMWIPLAIMLGVTHEIRRSSGRRSVTPTIVVAGAVAFISSGLINFSKEGMFSPIACYLIAVCSMRYRMKLGQLIALIAVILLMSHYLVPYSQYGRSFKTKEDQLSAKSFGENAAVSIELLSDLNRVLDEYKRDAETHFGVDANSYFNTDQGLFGRLQMIQPDDMLIDAAVRGKASYGLVPLYAGLGSAVPHFLWPEKPDEQWGNLYAHQIGGLIDDRDFTTGISFTPSGDGYYMAGWYGVLLIAPAVWLMLFVIYDSLFGDTRRSPWGLVTIVLFAHIAPEALLGGPFLAVNRSAPGLAIAAFTCAYVMPVLGSIFIRSRGGMASGRPAAQLEG